tara:strand:- start:1414 stop:2886 length:1473 start_codon:yes stop_codon:yes gene_type:complete
MATSNASSFNENIGGLRGRSNSDAQFAKAMNDRMAMIKFDAPSDNQARISQVQSKLGSTMGAFKGVSDMKATGVKIKGAYDKVQTAGKKITSKVGELGDQIGEASDRVPQQGVRALTTEKLPKATLKVKTKTTNLGPSGEQQPTKTTLDPSAGEVQNPSSGDAPKQAEFGKDGSGRLGGTTDNSDAVRTLDPTKDTIQTTLDPADAKTGPMGGDGKTDTPNQKGPMGGDGNTDTPTQVPKDQLPDVGPIGDGPAKPSMGSLTQTADNSIASGQRGDQTIARTLGSRSRAVSGMGQEVSNVRSNAMNVSSMTSADQGANATLGNLSSSLKSGANNIAGHVPTGGMAETSTNIHASVSQALEDFKGQVGGALSDVQSQIKGVAGQVSQVGKGVGAVGEDIASGASKAVEGISTGLEVAGGVADALGPIGDLIGLGMSIFGGVEEHKEHEQEKQANQQAQQTIAQKPEESTQQATSVSLDTSKQAQASVASHY